MKFKKIAVALCAAALSLTVMSVTAFAADAGVKIDATHFPDANFREYVKEFDTDGSNSFSADEIAKATYMYCNSCDISSLNGIEYFTALKYLYCSNNQLTKLNLNNNTVLNTLTCDSNQITDLNVRGCTVLELLDCSNNQLTALDVSKNTDLLYLFCHTNKFTKLDLSNNTALVSLVCINTQLTNLDISKNTELAELECTYNNLTKLDVSKNTKLRDLNCYGNQLASLDISNNPYIVKAYTKGEDEQVSEDAIEKRYEEIVTSENGDTTAYYFYFYYDKATKIITASKSHTHTWDSGKVTKAATYGATGVKTYTCTICGAKKTSSIAKKTVKKLTAKTTYSCTTNAVRINWNKLSGVTGYKIFRYDDAKKKWVAVKAIYDPNTTNYKISGLKSGKVYKFRVKAFVKENGKFYFGESCSTISTATRPNTTTVTKANKTSTAVRLFWKKTTCSGYRILRYDSAKKKWVRVTAVGSSATTQYKISGLKKNTTYKFKVQPYVKVGSKVIDGAASAVFTVKTSK